MELHRLSTEAVDNGHWDQAFDYASGHRDSYINENFTRDGLDTIRVQVLWIGDSAGNVRVSRGTRDALPGKVTELPADILSGIQKFAPTLLPMDDVGSAVKLLRVSGGV